MTMMAIVADRGQGSRQDIGICEHLNLGRECVICAVFVKPASDRGINPLGRGGRENG